jgi:hypothetical protein
MATALPNRSHSQRLEALELANRIRTHRSHLKRELKARRLHVRDVLDDPLLATMKVADLLMAIPGYGKVRCRDLAGEAARRPDR